MTLPTAPAAKPGTTPGAWQATHVFYAANPRPFLLHCVRPLVAELEADGLLAGYFFINYWLEGPHVRLRLKPSSTGAEAEVARRTGQAVDAFLAERPALYEVDSGFLNDFYNTLFEIEFPGSERGHYMDGQGRMNLRPNNSRHREPYEPEFGKYGGPAGSSWPSGTSATPAIWSSTRSPPRTSICARSCSAPRPS